MASGKLSRGIMLPPSALMPMITSQDRMPACFSLRVSESTSEMTPQAEMLKACRP